MTRSIRIENAHQNNLKHLDLTLPHGELVVVTGVSGSGKSTLAFDTIYAEGQRRYVETFSPYARQFLDRMDKPRVDRIEGIPPAIAIDQTNPVRTSRSTVGTMTELNDHIKLLFARCADLYCSGCGREVRRDTPEQIAAHWMNAEDAADTRLMVSFRVDIPENFSGEEIEDWLARQGFTRIQSRGKKQLEVIQDRLKTTDDNRGRLIEAIEAALRFGRGRVSVHRLDEARSPVHTETYSTVLQCEACKLSYSEPLPSTFSFNSPIGACEACKGFGRVMGIDYRLAVPDTTKSIKGGVVKVFQSESGKACQRDLVRAAKRADVPLELAYEALSDEQRDWVIEGDGGEDGWYGVKGFFDYLERKAYKMHVRVMLAKYRSYDECPDCAGARLKPESLNWRVGSLDQSSAVLAPKARWFGDHISMSAKARTQIPGLNVADMMRLPIDQLAHFVDALADSDIDDATRIVTDEMRSRITYLVDVGLGYLTLDRQSRTLSGGEVQRINLTTALGTSLVNTLFVLDEPSIGLHPRDIDRLTRVLLRLRDAGNSLIVVEHDPQLMVHADRIIDIGPGPGDAGGNIVFNGTPKALLDDTDSLTAEYLSGRKRIEFDALRESKPNTRDTITLKGATGHNLKNVALRVPLNRLVCITGPSGSGKSTLIQDTLFNALTSVKGKPKDLAEPFKTLTGHEHIDDVVMVDQSPIGKSARSNPVSYTGAFEPIRKLFERTPEAKERNYRASAFSFNSGMKCPACSGNGFEHVEMQFLSDVYIRCGECQGRRYRPELLEVKLFVDHEVDGQSIADVLDMTVDRALAFFRDEAFVTRALQPLKDVGLGYVTLGQPVPTLSGGEAQRLKLAAHLGEAKGVSSKHGKRGHTLFLFDEPTTGLHYEDIAKLLGAFGQLLDQGHSLVVVEHNLDVITCAEHVIDLGPEGGEAGGRIVFQGTVAKLLEDTDSATAVSLRDYQGATARLMHDEVAEAPAIAYAPAEDHIHVQHAREHNLKNIDVKIPRDAFTVITGKSGSGKSTLAFDIVFNEGQRRYLESLNAYARQFVQPASRPDVDAISGIPPTVAIEQRTSRGGRKSTVATMTEIYHFLRLLFVKLGEQYCPDCGVPISSQSVEAIASQLMKQHRGKTISLHAPLVTDRKGYYTDLAKGAANKGYDSLRVDGVPEPTGEWPRLDRFKEHTIDLPIGNIVVEPRNEQALVENLRLAVGHGAGVVKVAAGRGRETLYSVQRACPGCQRSFAELDPRMFSYNSRHGWCDNCYGTGELLAGFDEEQTGEESAWRTGDQEESIECPVCDGQRLRPESLSVWFQDHTIADFAALTISEARDVFAAFELDQREAQIARDILVELHSRLNFLGEVGLDYLALDRAAPTLSGGEAQRIRLAAQLGSNLEGVCYILDEPTIGLHPRDNQMLLGTLSRLQSKGNTVVVVEHDEETIRHADYIIDLGPGAGVRGGEVVAAGTLAEIRKIPESPTGQLLDQPLQHPFHPTRAKADENLRIEKARLHNLRGVTVDIPLRRFVCVSGVSGSGKSTLIRDVVHDNLRALNSQQKKARAKRKLGSPTGCQSISGWESIDRVLEVDQTPIGKTSRSCPATYIGFWDNIRRLFADTTEARIRGFTASRFSFNTGGGRCEECQGQGMQRIEMSFLPDVKVPCEVCKGARFNSETLSVRWKGISIGELLLMNVDDALPLFDAHPSVHHPLSLLRDVGLGYLTLGQASATLSGGEAQRIKLVSELSKAKPDLEDSSGRRVVKTHTMYILDEPSVGLHMADVENLIHVLHRLVDAGNSVILIEHNLDLMAEADWIIDMGPEGGHGGGRVVARGTPKRIAASKTSRTAPFLGNMIS